MQGKRDAAFSERRRKEHTVLDRHGGVRHRMPQEDRRSVFRHLGLQGCIVHLIGRRLTAGHGLPENAALALRRLEAVAEKRSHASHVGKLTGRDNRVGKNRGVRPGVYGGVSRIRLFRIHIVQGQRRSQMTAGGEAHDRDSLRIYVPFFRVHADRPDCTRGVI